MASSKKRTVLITGCSSGGIGAELAKEYHARGLRVIATARRLSAIDELHQLGIECLQLDVTQIDAIKKVRDNVAQLTGGTLDILVNNAGQGTLLPFIDVNMEDVRAMFEVNLFGVMMMVQEFVHLLIASGDGRIVNIGSVSAILPMPFGASYGATKAALHAFGNTLRQELKPFNVEIITIITGGVQTNIVAPHHLRALPPDSLYQPMNDDFVRNGQLRSQRNAMPADLYARTVVTATLQSHPKAWIWSGTTSWFTWFLDTFFPRTIWNLIIPEQFGLIKLKRLIQEKEKTA